MELRQHGTIAPGRLAELKALVRAHHTTERVFAHFDAHPDEAVDIVHMDEYTIDLVVGLADGLTLVYDTT